MGERRGLTSLYLGPPNEASRLLWRRQTTEGPDVDIVGDIRQGLDLPDSSVGVIRAIDFLPQSRTRLRCSTSFIACSPTAAYLMILTPSTDGRGAFQDPTHVAFYNENSFWYFTDQQYARFVPNMDSRFQSSRLVTYFPSEWHETEDPLCVRQSHRDEGRAAPGRLAADLTVRSWALNAGTRRARGFSARQHLTMAVRPSSGNPEIAASSGNALLSPR